MTSTIMLVVLVLISAVDAAAANHYVRAAATGTGSGDDWTNAYSAFPLSLTRGDTYYVAAGTYARQNFSDPESGTTRITIKAPTEFAHGTDTGWSNTFVGQATFAAISNSRVFDITTGYYTIDGVYGCDPTHTCGFRADMSPNTQLGCGAASPAITLEPNVASNITIQYMEINGSHDVAVDPNIINDSGFRTQQNNSNLYFGHNWVHDQGGLWMLLDGVDGAVIEYNWFQNNRSTPACHAEGIALRAPFGVGNTNLTVRYNRFENADGTGYFGTPVNGGATGPVNSNWYFYGNIFFTNAGEEGGRTRAAGGVIQFFSIRIANDFFFYNNTISAIRGFCNIIFAGGSTNVDRLTVRNNLWSGCSDSVNPAGVFGGVMAVTWTHNAYFNTATNDTDANKQVASGTPFMDVTQTAGHNDFRLAVGTSAGLTLGAPYNADIIGATRGVDATWDRGAYEFAGGAPPVVPPPAPGPPTPGGKAPTRRRR